MPPAQKNPTTKSATPQITPKLSVPLWEKSEKEAERKSELVRFFLPSATRWSQGPASERSVLFYNLGNEAVFQFSQLNGTLGRWSQARAGNRVSGRREERARGPYGRVTGP